MCHSVWKGYSSCLDPYVKHCIWRRYKGEKEVIVKEGKKKEGGQKKQIKIKCNVTFILIKVLWQKSYIVLRTFTLNDAF